MSLSILLALIILFPRECQAYIDPGAGSLFVQLLIAGLIGVLFTVKTYWSRLRLLFSKKDKNDKPESEDSEAD